GLRHPADERHGSRRPRLVGVAASWQGEVGGTAPGGGSLGAELWERGYTEVEVGLVAVLRQHPHPVEVHGCCALPERVDLAAFGGIGRADTVHGSDVDKELDGLLRSS